MNVSSNFSKENFGSNVFFKKASGAMTNKAGQLARVKGYIRKEATQITPIPHRDGLFVIDDTTLVGKLLMTILGKNAVYSKNESLTQALDDIITIPNKDTLIIQNL